MKSNGILWVPWDYDIKILSNLIIPKIHKPISLIQGIPAKDASALISKHHADAIGLIQEMEKLCFYDASSHWMVMAHDVKVSSSPFWFVFPIRLWYLMHGNYLNTTV